jgi:hypothetical protein
MHSVPVLGNPISVLPVSERERFGSQRGSELDPACCCFLVPGLHLMDLICMGIFVFEVHVSCKINIMCLVRMESSPLFSENKLRLFMVMHQLRLIYHLQNRCA